MLRSRIVLLSAVLAAVAPPALAHHGWANYGDEDVTVTGTVVSAQLVQPHGLIKVKNAQGVWDVMLSPLAGIQRSGLERSALPPGAQVIARGHRHRDPQRLEIKTERLTVGGKTYDLYPNRD